MNCLKNPRRDPRLINAVNCYEMACNVNVMCLANFLESLHELFPKQFGKTGMQRYLKDFIDSVLYLEADNDSEVREHRMAGILHEMPYITKNLAGSILKTLASQATAKDRAVLSSPEYRAGLVENIIMMIATLHSDYGFGEERIKRVIARWVNGKIGDGDEWLAENVDYISDPAADRRDMEDALLERKNRKNRVTVREQLDARRELEALRSYQEEIRK